MATTTYTKLRSGEWGLRTSITPRPGEQLYVTTKAGERKTETVGSIIWQGGGITICSIAAAAKRRQGYGGDGYRPVRGCGDCSRLGTMCKQCRFDAYDC